MSTREREIVGQDIIDAFADIERVMFETHSQRREKPNLQLALTRIAEQVELTEGDGFELDDEELKNLGGKVVEAVLHDQLWREKMDELESRLAFLREQKAEIIDKMIGREIIVTALPGRRIDGGPITYQERGVWASKPSEFPVESAKGTFSHFTIGMNTIYIDSSSRDRAMGKPNRYKVLPVSLKIIDGKHQLIENVSISIED